MKLIRKTLITAILLFVVAFVLTACGTANNQDTNGTGNMNQTIQDDQELGQQENAEDSTITNDYSEVLEGDVAPDFTAETADETTFELKAEKGKVVLLNFWATWCGPCVGEMPAFQKLYEEYGDKLSVLAVNYMEDKETVNQFIEETGYTFPIAYDEDGAICSLYPSEGIPYTLVIDENGVVDKIYVGASDAEAQYQEYKSAIEEVYNQ